MCSPRGSGRPLVGLDSEKKKNEPCTPPQIKYFHVPGATSNSCIELGVPGTPQTLPPHPEPRLGGGRHRRGWGDGGLSFPFCSGSCEILPSWLTLPPRVVVGGMWSPSSQQRGAPAPGAPCHFVSFWSVNKTLLLSGGGHVAGALGRAFLNLWGARGSHIIFLGSSPDSAPCKCASHPGKAAGSGPPHWETGWRSPGPA